MVERCFQMRKKQKTKMIRAQTEPTPPLDQREQVA
jgi:hypothetical protein